MYRLLIADDERIERDALRYTVQKAAEAIEEVYDATNGREAVSRALELRPDICFLDIKMPGRSGIEAAKEIRRHLPQVRIVFLTAFDYFDYAREAIRIGVDDYIIKPASEQNVVEVIRRIAGDLDRERSEREHSRRVAEKLNLVSTALEAEITEGITRGFVAEEKLTEFAALREFEFVSIVTASTTVDYESYPMRIQDDSHKSILSRRCVRLMQRLLEERGVLSVFAPAPGRFDSILYLPEGLQAEELLLEVAARVKVHLALGTSTVCGSITSEGESATKTPGGPAHAKGQALTQRAAAARRPPEAGGGAPAGFPPSAMEGRLLGAIATADRKAALAATDDIYEWLSAHTGSPLELSRVADELFVVIRHSLLRRYPLAEIEPKSLARTLASAPGPREGRSILRDQTDACVNAVAAVGGLSTPLAVRRAKEYIELHHAEGISLELLATEAGQSTYHLSRLFKRHTGSSIVEYLNSVRIDRAKSLLHAGRLAVQEVSRQVGFADPAYFARVFRRIEGVSPSVYRNRLVR